MKEENIPFSEHERIKIGYAKQVKDDIERSYKRQGYIFSYISFIAGMMIAGTVASVTGSNAVMTLVGIAFVPLIVVFLILVFSGDF